MHNDSAFSLMKASLSVIPQLKKITNQLSDQDLRRELTDNIDLLHERLISVSMSLVEACELNASYLETVGQLNKENAELRQTYLDITNWKNEEINYPVKEVAPRAYVRVYQPFSESEKNDHEPSYWLCPLCYDKGQRSILQGAGFDKGERVHKCHMPNCSFEIRVHEEIKRVHSRPRSKRAHLLDDYD